MNTTNPCSLLESYLDRQLSPTARSSFEQHLVTCEDCSRAVSQAEHLDRVLSRLRPVPAPANTLHRVRGGLRRQARMRRIRAIAIAASILILAGAAAIMWQTRESPNQLAAEPAGIRSGEPVGQPDSEIEVQPLPTPRVHIEVSSPESIVIPVETHHRDVSVVWVYPTFDSSNP